MTEYPAGTSPQPPRVQQEGTFQQGKEAAREVAATAREQTGVVAGEAREQTRQAVEQIREQARAQARHQSERAAQGIRQWADELAAMNDGAKPDSQVAGVVRQVADGGRRAADYLEQHGLAGVVSEVQDFARRKPAVFLAGALAAGFLVGRIAKATSGPQQDERRSPEPAPNAFTGGTYPAGPTPYAEPGSTTYTETGSAPYAAPGSAPYTEPGAPGTGPYGEPDLEGSGDPTRPVPPPGTATPPPGRAGDLP
ncbi:hypothetical protein OUY22_08830 [Nonomuraea sp. MCN248]|uniref:DUF3618 domain-containing protein n=1 Tax=Nonomuraea corallina TaxID=2989783 RepID=A0ABT4S8M2_9ACTN|nr:hypothetical protein [Nonomuraea corallina]MDA0633520.1 hypothetical protein [Nonomuraea corallina]